MGAIEAFRKMAEAYERLARKYHFDPSFILPEDGPEIRKRIQERDFVKAMEHWEKLNWLHRLCKSKPRRQY